MEVGVSFSALFRNQRNPVAGMDVDVAVQSRRSGDRAVAGVVRGSVDGFGALICRRKKRVVQAPGDVADLSIEIRVKALAASLRKILEVSRAQLHRRHEQNVVAIFRTESPSIPTDVVKERNLRL